MISKRHPIALALIAATSLVGCGGIDPAELDGAEEEVSTTEGAIGEAACTRANPTFEYFPAANASFGTLYKGPYNNVNCTKSVVSRIVLPNTRSGFNFTVGTSYAGTIATDELTCLTDSLRVWAQNETTGAVIYDFTVKGQFFHGTCNWAMNKRGFRVPAGTARVRIATQALHNGITQNHNFGYIMSPTAIQ